MYKYLKEKILNLFGSLSGGLGIISAHNVCHTICLGVIAILTIFGIAVSGMPLGFLQDYNLLFWNMAAVFLLVSLGLYFRNKKCMSNKAIIFNSGLIIAGVPFEPLQKFNPLFYIIGGILVIVSVVLYLKGKLK